MFPIKEESYLNRLRIDCEFLAEKIFGTNYYIIRFNSIHLRFALMHGKASINLICKNDFVKEINSS